MRHKLFLLFFFVILAFPFQSYASSSYVLPYPGSMPGSFSYKPHLLFEKVLEYWYFGNFSQFEYNLKESGKYLVEAKTLFDYQQYLLGYSALKKSDNYFERTKPSLIKAKSEGKDISRNLLILSNAAEKHIEVIEKLKKENPEEFNWQPEKTKASLLNLKSQFDASVEVRKKYL